MNTLQSLVARAFPALSGTAQIKAGAIARIGNAFRTSNTLYKSFPRKPVMNRAKRGLYHGKHIMFGNNVAHSERKTRRTWMPNVQVHRYYSDLLKKQFKLRVTTAAMRMIDKRGSLDSYLIKTPDVFLGGEGSIGLRLKKQILELIGQKNFDERAPLIAAMAPKQAKLYIKSKFTTAPGSVVMAICRKVQRIRLAQKLGLKQAPLTHAERKIYQHYVSTPGLLAHARRQADNQEAYVARLPKAASKEEYDDLLQLRHMRNRQRRVKISQTRPSSFGYIVNSHDKVTLINRLRNRPSHLVFLPRSGVHAVDKIAKKNVARAIYRKYGVEETTLAAKATTNQLPLFFPALQSAEAAAEVEIFKKTLKNPDVISARGIRALYNRSVETKQRLTAITEAQEKGKEREVATLIATQPYNLNANPEYHQLLRKERSQILQYTLSKTGLKLNHFTPKQSRFDKQQMKIAQERLAKLKAKKAKNVAKAVASMQQTV